MALIDLTPRPLSRSVTATRESLHRLLVHIAASHAARMEQRPTPQQRLEAERRYRSARDQVDRLWLR